MGSTVGAIVVLASILGIFLTWRVLKSNWIAARLPVKREQKRQSDKINLSPHQRRIYDSARQWHAAGKIEAAAQLLDSIGMMRQAVQMLEDNNFINEAANILIRMQRPNRAGYVYARNKRWKEAMRCFIQADMPLEAAKCAREISDFKVAADNFLRAGKLADAAECLLEIGNLVKAARIYTQLGDASKAIDLYRQIIAKTDDISAIELEASEVELITAHLSKGNVDLPLADLLATRNKLGQVILTLTTSGLTKAASELYLRSTSDLGPMLIAGINYLDASAKNLAEVFQNVSNFQYAGMVFQTLGSFQQAGDSFLKAEDFERAAYCYERAGNSAMVTEARIRMASRVNKKRSNSMADPALASQTPEQAEPVAAEKIAAEPDLADAFSLESVSDSDFISQNAMGSEERTELLLAASNATAENDAEYAAFARARFITDLSPSEKKRLWNLGKTLTFASNETVLNQGVEPSGVYFVLSGAINSYLDGQVYRKINAGESFCEFWVMAEIAPTVKFIAEANASIRVIPSDAFANMLEKDGTIARKLYKRFTRQLAEASLTPSNDNQIAKAS